VEVDGWVLLGDRRTFIIRSVINNNHFTTDPTYFRDKGI
jgi:hypothetical protein